MKSHLSYQLSKDSQILKLKTKQHFFSNCMMLSVLQCLFSHLCYSNLSMVFALGVFRISTYTILPCCLFIHFYDFNIISYYFRYICTITVCNCLIFSMGENKSWLPKFQAYNPIRKHFCLK